MKNLIKKSFQILRNNMLFIQPLLFGLLLIMSATAFLYQRNLYIVPKIALILSMVLIFISFSAGWFFINKLAVVSYDENDLKEEITLKSIENFKKFFEGVGKHFLNVAFSYLILFLIFAIIFIVTSKLCLIAFGEPKIIHDFPKLITVTSQAEFLNYINTLTTNDLAIFGAWMLVVNIVSSILNYYLVLFFAVLNFEDKDVSNALFQATKFFFKNLGSSIIIILFTAFLYFLLNMISVVLGNGSLSFVILIILFTLYLNYYVLLVFCFYYDKTKINSDNRTEFIG